LIINKFLKVPKSINQTIPFKI